MKAASALLVVAACSTSPSSFHYTATVFWTATDAPDVTAVSVDGNPIEPRFTIDETFDSFADAEAAPHDVQATTTKSVVSFQLVPTRCGGACDNGEVACDDLTVENDDWIFFHGLLAFDNALEFGADEGSCGSIAKPALIWAD